MIADPLANGVTGVGAQLLTLTLDGTDTRPEVPVAIINAADDDAAVSQKGLTDWPLIVVAVENPGRYKLAGVGNPLLLDVPEYAVTVAYVSRDTVEPAQAWRDGNYVLVAALKALLVGLFAADKAAARTRGNVTISSFQGADIVPVDGVKVDGGGKVTAALLINLNVRHQL